MNKGLLLNSTWADLNKMHILPVLRFRTYLHYFLLWYECLHPCSPIYIETLTSKDDGISRDRLWKVLKPWRLSPDWNRWHIKETSEGVFSTMDSVRNLQSVPRKGFSSDTKFATMVTLDFPASWTVRNKCVCLYTTQSLVFHTAPGSTKTLFKIFVEIKI